MKKTLRAFLAVELPGDAREALAGLVQQLRQARIEGLRPVDPTGIHLTIKFLGKVPRTQVESIVTEVSRMAAGHHSFTIVVNGVGVFPSRDAPRVLWVGVEGDLPMLVDLHRDMEDVLEGLGFARDRREFSPHLTVARIAARASSTDRRRAAEALLSAGFEPGLRIDVRVISLIHSILLPQGARYERLAEMPLAGAVAKDVPE